MNNAAASPAPFLATVTDRSDRRRPSVYILCGGVTDRAMDGTLFHDVRHVSPLNVSATDGGPDRLADMVDDFRRVAAANGGVIPVSCDFNVSLSRVQA